MVKNASFILMTLGLLLGGNVQAAGVFSEAKSYLEDEKTFYKLDIFLDTDGQSVNVLEGEILYAEQNLNFEKISDGGSVINFWIKKPEHSSGGRITFSGGTPGGYRGAKGFLFSVVFSTKEGASFNQSEFSFQNFKSYWNDGKGTEEGMADSKNTFDPEKIELVSAPEDVKAPEIFAPYVTQVPDLAEGKWVVLLAAQDKGGGIDHYEVIESEEKYTAQEIKTIDGVGWEKVESGEIYVLKDQSLESYVYVRALDNLGNFKIAEVVPANDQDESVLNNKLLLSIIILLVVGIIFVLEIFIFKRKK